MYMKSKDIEKRKAKYLGTINSTVKVLSQKAKSNLRLGYNQIVVDRGCSFHDPTIKMWMIKGNNNINELESIYKKVVVETLELFGMSRKSDYGVKMFNQYMNR